MMAIMIKAMNKPEYCFLCRFGIRVDNGHVMCSLHPTEQAIADGESIPEHCLILDIGKTGLTGAE